jgi:AcrR family transcriptional regulator
MGRHKTVTDEAILGVAREVFRAYGHTATTRQVADAAGVSEAVLYQRFGSKDDLFFAAMHPPAADVEALLGPPDPPGDAREYLRAVCVRLGRHFAEHIPLALRLMTHPSFDPASLARATPGGPPGLRQGLAARLAALARRGQLRPHPAAAKLLISLAHDWALGTVMSHGRSAHPERELRELVDAVWDGMRPAQPS